MESRAPDVKGGPVAPWRQVSRGVRWDDLVLPPALLDMLRSLSREARQLAADHDRERGLVCLFTGERGTGKRTAARAIATELRTSVIEVDTPTVCSRGPAGLGAALWRLRRDGAREGAVLLFADAGEYLRDAAQRRGHRSSELAYNLLARCADYPGLTVVSSRRTVRLDPVAQDHVAVHLTFPFPDADARAHLWRAFLPSTDLLSESDIRFMASSFMLSGGTIARCCADAQHVAERSGRPARREDIVDAIHAHYEGLLTSVTTRSALAHLRASQDAPRT